MIIPVSKITIGAVLSGVVGLCFLSYFVFLGPERRSDKVTKMNRLKKRLATKDGETTKMAVLVQELHPGLKQIQADQKIFEQDVNMGEFYLIRGNEDLGVKHLVNAMMTCQNPTVLYQVLQKKLSKRLFEMLTKKLSPEQLELWSSSSNLNLGDVD
ncbi:TOMM20-like protein 1 [Myzus persicae]|uniref:TOMM20-like protein 1 n=1 Tax=Myzus persicae TaxID=13164 RepID=UPI000B92F8C0|nr:TOMM20-like protein 1 [Myzus persicae]